MTHVRNITSVQLLLRAPVGKDSGASRAGPDLAQPCSITLDLAESWSISNQTAFSYLQRCKWSVAQVTFFRSAGPWLLPMAVLGTGNNGSGGIMTVLLQLRRCDCFASTEMSAAVEAGYSNRRLQ